MKPCKSIYFDNRPHPQEFLYPSKFHPPHRLAQNIGNTTFDPQEVWPCSQGVQFRRLHRHLSQKCAKSVRFLGQYKEKLYVTTSMGFLSHTYQEQMPFKISLQCSTSNHAIFEPYGQIQRQQKFFLIPYQLEITTQN